MMERYRMVKLVLAALVAPRAVCADLMPPAPSDTSAVGSNEAADTLTPAQAGVCTDSRRSRLPSDLRILTSRGPPASSCRWIGSLAGAPAAASSPLLHFPVDATA
jgi:hypothetical protein